MINLVKQPAQTMDTSSSEYDVCIIGGGPGGYTAAFRAADLGLKTALIERYDVLGGVCLNVGCIPSKTLLHTTKLIIEAQKSTSFGIEFLPPNIDLSALSAHKKAIVAELNQGLKKMVKLRNITHYHGEAKFIDDHRIQIISEGKQPTNIHFSSAIIAVGSRPAKPSFIPAHQNIWYSTEALELRQIPKRMAILGGGIIGLEMATVYHALGSEIDVIELESQIIPEADKDIITPLMRSIKNQYKNIWLNTRATSITPNKNGIVIELQGKNAPQQHEVDVVLVSVGRQPNGKNIDADKAGVQISDHGFISVNEKQQTNVPHIYAIGDVVGNPMLAHKATHQAKVTAEVIAGEKSIFNPITIPSVAYTHPEVAWAGQTEKQLIANHIDYQKGVFPWQASSRALSSNQKNGLSKAMFCSKTGRLLGAAIVGANAGELISEAVLGMEMGANADDISLTIHPHPTLSETFAMASEIVNGSITDLPKFR